MAKISIVLPTCNGEKYINKAIDSICTQTFSDWELLIVNDCSTDNTSKIVKEYLKKDSRIKLINNSINQRLPKSLNIGFNQATGEFLTWTSDDNVYFDNAIEKMYEFLVSNKQYPMVCTSMEYIDENGNRTGRCMKYDEQYMYYNDCVGACFMYRKEVIDCIGEYDTNRFLVEDYDYWMRVLLNCGKIGFINEILYSYRRHSRSLTNTRKQEIRTQLIKMRDDYKKSIFENLIDKRLLFKICVEYIESGVEIKDLDNRFIEEFPFLNNMDNDEGSEKILVYGAGCYGDRVNEILKGHFEYYVDGDINKVGKTKNGKMVLSIEEMIRLYNNDYKIIIALGSDTLYEVLNDVISKYNLKFDICQHMKGWYL